MSNPLAISVVCNIPARIFSNLMGYPFENMVTQVISAGGDYTKIKYGRALWIGWTSSFIQELSFGCISWSILIALPSRLQRWFRVI